MKQRLEIGDLVQFSQEVTERRRCWEKLPQNGHDFQGSKTLPLILQLHQTFDIPTYSSRKFWVMPDETVKFPMTLVDIVVKCYTSSKLQAIKNAQTKIFANVLLFETPKTSGPPIQHSFWVLYDDLEPYSGFSYMEDFKLKLKAKVSEHKMSKDKK